MKKLAIILLFELFIVNLAFSLPNQIVIIRHGEKPGENAQSLSCKGLHRALTLVTVLPKFGNFKQIYVPSLAPSANMTLHSRMFQTVSPFAIAYNIPINSNFSASKKQMAVAKAINQESGDILVVWNHTDIPALATSLGVTAAPSTWDGKDFDSVWIITYSKVNHKPSLKIDQENISPVTSCNF